jgi:hypothetical protein
MYMNKGQTVIMLMVFMVVAVTITTAAVVLTIINSRNASRLEQGEAALSLAHSGGENAMMRLLRDPSYTGETLSLGDGSVTTTVSGSNPKTVLSVGRFGNFSRTVQIVATGSGFLTVSSWKEAP